VTGNGTNTPTYLAVALNIARLMNVVNEPKVGCHVVNEAKVA